MNRRTKYVCAQCRQFVTGPLCQVCKQQTIAVSFKWRIPKKNNDSAWRTIKSGNIMWDQKAIDKSNIRPWLMRYDLDGTQRCPAGHKLVQPNLVPHSWTVQCAACHKARIGNKDHNVSTRQLADKYYKEMNIA